MSLIYKGIKRLDIKKTIQLTLEIRYTNMLYNEKKGMKYHDGVRLKIFVKSRKKNYRKFFK
jgi:hypothetical protein